MILSIGMIVKNEEKYLRMCLEALQPLRDAIDSELIIADTGSTDKTVDIAKEFTDKVFYFEWCNDYAKARNSTLEKAKGEWFMFVDADEILQNPKSLIDFFRSREYKSYDEAKIIQRNKKYADSGDERYADFYPTRLAKRTKDIRFCNPIHEVFYPAGKRQKDLNAIFIHYGYTSERKLYQKGVSYSVKILKELEKSPHDVRLYTQLTDAYQPIDLYKAISCSIDAVNKCPAISSDVLYEGLISCLCKAKDYVKAQKAAEKYFSYSSGPRITYINIYNQLINMYYKNGNYDNVIDTYKQYKTIRNLVLSKKIASEHIRSLYISDFYYIYNTATLMLSYIKIGKYNKAQDTLCEIYKYPASAKSNITTIIIAVFELYEKNRKKQSFIEFIRFADKIGCMAHINKIINSFLYGSNPCGDYIYDILKIMYEYDKNNDFYQFYNLLCKEKYSAPQIKEYISKTEHLLPSIHDMAYFIFKYNYALSDESVRFLKTNNIYTERSHFSDFSDIVYNAVTTIEDTSLIIPLCEQIFVFWEDVSFEKRENLKKIYYNAVSDNIMDIVNDNVTPDNCNILPPVIRFRYLYKQMTDAGLNKDYETEKYIRSILENIDLPINIFKNNLYI